MQNFPYRLRQEGLEMRSRFDLRVMLVHIVIVGVFGILFPWFRGIDFLDPVTITAYACLGVLLSPPAAAQAYLRSRPSSLTDALARIVLAVAYGEAMVAAILLTAFITVFAANRYAFAPELATLAEALALGLMASFALSAVAAWIALCFSAGIARNAMRVIFLLLLYLFFQKSRWLPDVAIQGCFVSFGVALLAMFAIQRQLTKPPKHSG